MGLQLRNKTPKRRVKAKLREDRQSATRPNESWAMDFVHDQLVTGRKLRVLTIIDTFSRFSPAIEPRFNFRGPDVVEILEEVGRQVGFPKAIRVDQGTEFVSRDLDLWAYRRGVTLDFSRPGKPTDNAFIESFNGKFRAECLNALQRDRQQSPDRADRSVSGIQPVLTGTGWKKPSNLVQGWGAAHSTSLRTESISPQ